MNKDTKSANPQKGVFKTQSADINSKRIFENHTLAAQFLRDYSGIKELMDIRPEEIETVKLRFHLFNETELNADSANRVLRTKRPGKVPIYIVPIIDHKSKVDYNVSIQFFYYIACIWRDWEKEMKGLGFDCRDKNFLYPMVLPIVYYEGTDRWTADLHLTGRIHPVESLRKYTPDFMYHVVSVHAHSSEELLKKNDEMSLLMLLDKIQTSGDIPALRKLDFGGMNRIIKDPEVLDIITGIVQSLCRNMNLPGQETRNYIEKIRGEKSMGYLFENMEKMDIQAERRNTAEQKQRADNEAKRADAAEEKVRELTNILENIREEQTIAFFISILQDFVADRAEAKKRLIEKYGLDEPTAEEKMDLYWKK